MAQKAAGNARLLGNRSDRLPGPAQREESIRVDNSGWMAEAPLISPAARRAALAKLIGGLERLDRLVERNRGKIEEICRERGLDFSRLIEEAREGLVDAILHAGA
ncbi:MAG: hypothetical protein HY713_12060 [candidate division NC10 bacterium]|nr:hypothetical protein [candidate division NC10 bacterium]